MGVYPLVGAVCGHGASPDRGSDRGFGRSARLGAVLCAVGLGAIALATPELRRRDVLAARRPRSWPAILGIVFAWLALRDLAIARPGRPPAPGRLSAPARSGDRSSTWSTGSIVGWGIGLVGFRALDLGPSCVAMAVATVDG